MANGVVGREPGSISSPDEESLPNFDRGPNIRQNNGERNLSRAALRSSVPSVASSDTSSAVN